MVILLPESPSRQAIPPSLLRWYRQQFVNRPDTYCTFDPVSYVAERQHASCSEAVLAANFTGEQCIALDTQTARRKAKWISVESDAPDALDQLQAVHAHLLGFGLVGLLEVYSGQPCLWLLLDEPLAAPPLWYFMDSFVSWLAHSSGGIDPDDLIVLPDLRLHYPKVADTVCPPGSYDAQIGTFTSFVDAHGVVCHGSTLVDMLTWLYEQPRMTCEDIVTALHVMHGYEQANDDEYAAVIAELHASSRTAGRRAVRHAR